MMENKKSEKDWQRILSIGWISMFAAFSANLIMDMVRCNVGGDCAPWASHIGPGGLVVITIIMSVYTLMPILIQLVTVRFFRFIAIGLTSFITLFYIAHEITHTLNGDKPFGVSHSLDIIHHIIGISMVIVAVKWARSKQTEIS